MLDARYPAYVRFAYGFLMGVLAVAGLCVWAGSGLKGCQSGSVWVDLKEIPLLFYHFGIVLVPFCSLFGLVASFFTTRARRSNRTVCFAVAALVAECVILGLLILPAPCVYARF
jgi:hypothetical protein